MEAQLNALKQQEAALEGKNASVADCDTPEKMAAFMESEGFTEEDIEKAFSGDAEAANEVLKKHTDFMAGDEDVDMQHQDEVLAQVEHLSSQLAAMDKVEAKMDQQIVEHKKHKGKKGRGKKGRGGAIADSSAIEAQKQQLNAIREKLRVQLAEAEKKKADAERKQANLQKELSDTQDAAKQASQRIDDSVEALEREKAEASDSDSDDEIDKEENIQRAKAAQSVVKEQQAKFDLAQKMMSGELDEEEQKPEVKAPKKIEGEGWGGGFFKKDKVESREESAAARKVRKAAEKKEAEAKAIADKRAAVKAKMEATLGKKSTSVAEPVRAASTAPVNEVVPEPIKKVISPPTSPKKNTKQHGSITPEYVIKRLKESRVSVTIMVPELSGMAGVDLDISDSQLKLTAPFSTGSYNLTVNFTDKLSQQDITAKFSKKKKELKVVIPTL